MEDIKLMPFQLQAITAIQKAVTDNDKYIVVDIPTGYGKSIVLAKTVEEISKLNKAKILVVTNTIVLKEKLIDDIFKKYRIIDLDEQASIEVETEHRAIKYLKNHISRYDYLIFYNVVMSQALFDALDCKDKIVIEFSSNNIIQSQKPFRPNTAVYAYTFKDAVVDGIVTPAMDPKALEPAIEIFCVQFLKQFGYDIEQSNKRSPKNRLWDLQYSDSERNIFIEWKAYKNQVVSPSAAVSLLNTMVMRRIQQQISSEDIVLLIVLSKIPTFQKDEIYSRYKIVVLDIENLVFYCKDSQTLLKQLSQITYFPIDHIEGLSSSEAHEAGFLPQNSCKEKISDTAQLVHEAEIEESETSELIQCLKNCKPGKKYSGEYEQICERIIRYLFESNYFNRLSSQHKTKDEHFRMDLIGSLKINQNNDEHMHPFWKMLVQHYNSHFVVFEFKNYSKEIDQNLLYVTEKYLFNAALRNVAIVISRKGFSKSAHFAAEGCLKENGKLILDINDEDLINMLELKNDEAADYLLEKLENFLMNISK